MKENLIFKKFEQNCHLQDFHSQLVGFYQSVSQLKSVIINIFNVLFYQKI